MSKQFKVRTVYGWVLSPLLCSLLAGCFDPPEIEPLVPLKVEKPEEEEPAEAELLDARRWVSQEQLPTSAWYVQYLGGKRVGYFHVEIDQGDLRAQDGSALIHFLHRKSVFDLQGPDGKPMRYVIELESREFPDGKLASFSETTTMGEKVVVVSGELSGETLKVSTKEDDKPKRSSVKWQAGTWGVLGVQSLLLAEPMSPGERRRCNILAPNPCQIVPMELVAEDKEITAVPRWQNQEADTRRGLNDGRRLNLAVKELDRRTGRNLEDSIFWIPDLQ